MTETLTKGAGSAVDRYYRELNTLTNQSAARVMTTRGSHNVLTAHRATTVAVRTLLIDHGHSNRTDLVNGALSIYGIPHATANIIGAPDEATHPALASVLGIFRKTLRRGYLKEATEILIRGVDHVTPEAYDADRGSIVMSALGREGLRAEYSGTLDEFGHHILDVGSKEIALAFTPNTAEHEAQRRLWTSPYSLLDLNLK